MANLLSIALANVLAIQSKVKAAKLNMITAKMLQLEGNGMPKKKVDSPKNFAVRQETTCGMAKIDSDLDAQRQKIRIRLNFSFLS